MTLTPTSEMYRKRGIISTTILYNALQIVLYRQVTNSTLLMHYGVLRGWRQVVCVLYVKFHLFMLASSWTWQKPFTHGPKGGRTLLAILLWLCRFRALRIKNRNLLKLGVFEVWSKSLNVRNAHNARCNRRLFIWLNMIDLRTPTLDYICYTTYYYFEYI